MLSIGVLGPLEVSRDDEPVHVPRGKASEVLVRLAVEPGAAVDADRLLQDLWADESGAARRNTLQVKVGMLRRALGNEVVVAREGGYALRVDADHVDANAALRRTTTAVRYREAGDAARAVEVSADGLALFRGEVLHAAGGAAWSDVHRARLQEARLTLLEVQFWARLSLGDHATAIGELEAAVGDHPFQESLWELLMTALYRSGRQADALAAYQRVRVQLVEELGVDPGPGLQLLERRILSQDESLAGPPDAPTPTVRPRRSNLPTLDAGLVGRRHAVEEVLEALSAHRLVEIVGPGGVGKTALALEVGRRLLDARPPAYDGVWLARLESATGPTDVLDALVAALGVPGEAALLERLRSSTDLVILDNCEHVWGTVSELAVRLLDQAPSLRVLATSQVRLDVDGSPAIQLEPLEPTDAVELFTRRAASRVSHTGSAQDEQAVADLCRELDGLPLAIELAAARTRTLTVAEISRRLDDRFAVLRDPASRSPDRRRSLRSTITWSYELLFPDDQRGLWALATFAGGATMEAATSVLASLDVPATAAMDVVDRLVGRSLVIVDDDPATGLSRFRLLDSIRVFSLEALEDSGLSDAAFAAHARWFADASRASTVGVRSAQQAEHLAFARAERANIDVALAWCAMHDPPQALEVAAGFGWAWVVLGDSRGAERIGAALDAVGEGGDARRRAEAMLLAGWIEASSGDLGPARLHVDSATEVADALDDRDLRARCAYYLAYVVSHHGEWEHALELTDRSAALYDGLDRPWDRAANALFAARAAISAGDVERSQTEVASAQGLLRAVDDPWLRVRGDAMLGELARVRHRFDDAVVYLASAADTSGRLGFLQTEAYQLSSLGRAQCQAGDHAVGRATLAAAVGKAEATGDVRLAALARVHLGRVLRADGDLTAARAALESASAFHLRSGGGEQAPLGDCLLAALDAADRVPGAVGTLERLLAEARRGGPPHVEVFALDALARAAAYDGDLARARELLAQADDRMPAASHFVAERDRVDAAWVRQQST